MKCEVGVAIKLQEIVSIFQRGLECGGSQAQICCKSFEREIAVVAAGGVHGDTLQRMRLHFVECPEVMVIRDWLVTHVDTRREEGSDHVLGNTS